MIIINILNRNRLKISEKSKFLSIRAELKFLDYRIKEGVFRGKQRIIKKFNLESPRKDK